MFRSWRYRNVKDLDGPINKTSYLQFTEGPLKGYFEAYAYLKENHDDRTKPLNGIYGSSDGTGTSKSKSEAIYISISEAIESWVFQTIKKNHTITSDKELETKTSTGLSVYPSYFNRKPKIISLLEARERFTLTQWYEKKIGHIKIDSESLPYRINGILLNSPWDETKIVILWCKEIDNVEFYTYGFAAHFTQEKAIEKSLKELWRNIYSLKKFYTNDSLKNTTTMHEERLLFFSTKAGYECFSNRVNQKIDNSIVKPKILLHSRLKGPWDRYARVWRTLYENNLGSSFSNGKDYFYF